MIGDGMGLAHITAARLHARGAGGELAIDRLPVTGHARTHSATEVITDSAAAATALATGIRTRNRRLAVAPDGRHALTILEAAHDRGLATGLVATSTITHATPAAFAVHVNDRGDEMAIAAQMIEAGVDVLLGGGRSMFLPREHAGGRRDDGRNLLDEARTRGYAVVDSATGLSASTADRVIGLFRDGPMPDSATEPTLATLTASAINRLSRDPDGFLLMVEGSQIDWASHENDGGRMLAEMARFDEAIAAALEFAGHDGRTLLVVTGDHETGGVAIRGGDMVGGNVDLAWSADTHTGVDVPVYAFGPRAIEFTGTYDNTRIPQLFAGYLGIRDFPRLSPQQPRDTDP